VRDQVEHPAVRHDPELEEDVEHLKDALAAQDRERRRPSDRDFDRHRSRRQPLRPMPDLDNYPTPPDGDAARNAAASVGPRQG